MDGLLEIGGVWLAKAYAFYGLAFLLAPAITFAYVPLLAAVVWAAASHSRGRQPWPYVPAFARRWVRLAVEITFGLINPVLYLALLTPSLSFLRSGAEWWLAPLTAGAWILLATFWTLRVFGAALDPHSRAVRAGVPALLVAALACLLLYTAKDLWLAARMDWGTAPLLTVALIVLRVCPLYLVPAVLLLDYIRSQSQGMQPGFFVLRDHAARGAVAAVAAVALVTIAFATHRRSDASVRKLVRDHRESIWEAAQRYDVDARLIASIVYVTHRDQLSPFRNALERVAMVAWATDLRRELGMRPPDRFAENGVDEVQILLNRPLDISVGLAQIKPRTAQTASLLAAGRRPDDLPKPAAFVYRDGEPAGDAWTLPAAARTSLAPPIPVPAEKQIIANTLMDARSNLATCALILALYQNQWEATNRDWSLRARPDILATLYQIGFARSKPHGAPRSNAFGNRVRQVYEQRWLGELLEPTPRPPT